MKTELNTRTEIIKYIDDANTLVWNLRGSPNVDFNPFLLLEDTLEKSNSIEYNFGIAQSTLNLGMGAFILKQNNELSLKLLNEALSLFKLLDDKKWIANTYITLAIIANSTGNPESALYNGMKGIEFYETNEDSIQDSMMAYYVIGTVYKDLKKYDEAEKYFLNGAKFNFDKSSWSGRIYTGLSNIYNEKGQFEKALNLAFKSLDILRSEKNRIGESRALNDIGSIYKKLKNFDNALNYFSKGLTIREDIKVSHFILGSLLEIATLYLDLNNSTEAINYFLRAEKIALETNHETRLVIIYQNLAELYNITDNLGLSINYYQKIIQLSNNLNNKDREIKIDNLHNSLLQEKEQEIERLRNVELKNAYALISEKNKEITDSINYAKRIQFTLLANDDLLKRNLNEYFVMFNPKDIVSGDFYWATEHNGKFYLAVCDCTGHGVPGAFMSLLNIGFLSEAINEKNIDKPNEVLNFVRKRLIESIGDNGQDGMDAILICIDKKTNIVNYAAANNEPVLVNSGEIKYLPNDKMPVGKGEKTDSFSLHQIDFNSGDILFLYTDGYADQFGGPKGKKFKYKPLNELLLSNSGLSMSEQKEKLMLSFNDWKGNLEQVDDVCLIGIKI